MSNTVVGAEYVPVVTLGVESSKVRLAMESQACPEKNAPCAEIPIVCLACGELDSAAANGA
jgi:hypothetical protein